MNQKALNEEASIRREFVAPVPLGANDGPWSLSQFREGDDALRVWCRGRGQTDKARSDLRMRRRVGGEV